MYSPSRLAAIGILSIWAAPISVPAAEVVWQNPSGGNWNVAANWNGGVPTLGEEAWFGLGVDDLGQPAPQPTGEIYLTADGAADSIQDAAGVMINLRGFDLLIDGPPSQFGGTSIVNTAPGRSSVQHSGVFGGTGLTIGRRVDADFIELDGSLIVSDGGTVGVANDAVPGAANSGRTFRVSGLNSTLTIHGDILEPSPTGLPFPQYRIFVEDQGLMDVRRSVQDRDNQTGIDVGNAILQVNSGFRDRQVRGYGVIVAPHAASLAALEIINPLDRVSLDRDLEIDSKTATVFSLGVADLGESTRAVNGGILRAADGVRVGEGRTLFADGASTIDTDVELAGGVLEVLGSLAGTVSGYGVVQNSTLSNSHPIFNAPAATVNLQHDLEVGAQDAIVFSAGPAQLGPNTTLGGGTLTARGAGDSVGALLLGESDLLSGNGTVDGQLIGSPTSHLEVAGGNLTVGTLSNSVSDGFRTDGQITLTSGRLLVHSPGVAQLGSLTELAGNGINGLGTTAGIALGPGDRLVGPGRIDGDLTAAAGSIIQATGGALFLGNPASPAGFVGGGELHTLENEIALRDANQAVLGSLTTLGDAGTPGTLSADNGLVMDFGGNLTGHGTVDTPDDPLKPFINNGHIEGDSAAEPITLEGYVKGVGTMNNVVINGTSSPGFSPAAVIVGNVAYSDSATLFIELGGTTPGSQFDQINSTGALNLDGTLDVDLINGFSPTQGDVFEILSAANGISGMFANELLPALAGNLMLDVVYGANTVSLVAVLPGDFNFDGSVDAADYVVWRKNGGTQQEYDAWAANFGAVAGSSSGNLNAITSVPEPGSWFLVLCCALFCAGRAGRLAGASRCAVLR